MSDGPHRCLNLLRHWKKVAKISDIEASSLEDVGEEVVHALEKDWRREISTALLTKILSILGDNQSLLFPDQILGQLQDLHKGSGGQHLEQLLIDCASLRATKGEFGPDAVKSAVADVLQISRARHARQIEEHYCRESTSGRARNVSSRILAAFDSANCTDLVGKILGSDAGLSRRAPSKHTGLDEGVKL